MLRAALIVVFGVLFVAAVVTGLVAGPALLGPIVMLGLILAGLVFENFRYRRVADHAPGGDFVETGERFVDPESGKLVVVHADARTGARRYVAVGDAQDTP